MNKERLRHTKVDFQTFKEIKHYPLDFHIEKIAELALIYDSEEFEDILDIMSEPSDVVQALRI